MRWNRLFWDKQFNLMLYYNSMGQETRYKVKYVIVIELNEIHSICDPLSTDIFNSIIVWRDKGMVCLNINIWYCCIICYNVI